MLKTFIDRPVLSTVISIIIVILGVLGLQTLPVTQYPDIAPPTVQVTASYPGANAQTILESVIIPIEEQINGVEDMTYMTSSASNAGSATITVFFKQGVNPDIASVNVQNRVARANSVLPSEVTRAGVITQKQQNSALMYVSLLSRNPDYNDTYLQNYLNINVSPEIQRIDGVGAVNVFGGKDYSMRVWLDPDKMAAYGLSTSEVIAAINEQSREAAAGSLGQNSGEAFEYVITYKGRYKTDEEYKNIIIRSLGDGQFLRVGDVAKVELDAFSYSSVGRSAGYPSINFGVFQTPGSNAQAIIEDLYVKLEELKAGFPPGVDYTINYDTNKFLTASIDKVKHTLIEAFLLVFLVVFIFLQDFKSTIIPGIAVPVAIIGTFFFLQIFGYSINLLTLFALILAIGIVVDDAIVVVEAVHAKLEEGETDANKATKTAMSEISGAIISITLVMAAVFVPITFIQGPAGVFYEQFGVTLIVAILISAVNALTLSPALCALFLRKHNKHGEKKKNLLQRFYAAFNASFNAISSRYIKSLGFLTKHKWVTALVLVLAGLSIWYTNSITPTGFVPTEDRGVIFVNMELPEGASMDRTFEATQQLYKIIEKVPGVRTGTVISGRNFFSGSGSSYGMGFIMLDSWEDRESDSTQINSILANLNQRAGAVADAKIIFFTPPSIPGFGSSDGFSVQILDRAAGDIKTLDNTATEFVMQLMQRPEVAYASNSFSTRFPQLSMNINVARAKESGVSMSDIISTMQGYIGGFYATDFSRFGKQYRVFVQADPEDRQNVADLNSMYVKTNTGVMAPVSQFVTLERSYGPQTMSRFNLFNAVALNGAAAPGYSSGDAIRAIQETAEQLPNNFDIAFSGITREEIASAGQSVVIFALSILFVYFFLAAQYESYLLPLSVLLSLPLGVAGAYFTTWVSGLENNIYFQIALIMLIGLLAKNAILIVEFALQRRKIHGMSITQSAIDGAKARLRPILMTSFAFILGLMPLVLARGVGAVGNRSIGTGAAGGMLIGTLLGLLFIPTLFIVFQYLQEKITGKPQAALEKSGE